MFRGSSSLLKLLTISRFAVSSGLLRPLVVAFLKGHSLQAKLLVYEALSYFRPRARPGKRRFGGSCA
jgi:hypothetical protein